MNLKVWLASASTCDHILHNLVTARATESPTNPSSLAMTIRPLIAICGTTGVGKSKLAIELALKLAQGRIHGWQGARIINADSMQIYTGMDVITNKVPETERQGIEHLLMGIREPGNSMSLASGFMTL